MSTDRFRAHLLAPVLALTLAFPALAAAAPRVQPWIPAEMDSVAAWATRARALFRANTGDSVGGTNIGAYEIVGKLGRHLIRSLGREHLGQAYAVETVIDSLGLDTEVALDPSLPYFAVMMVHNPFRPTADAVAFLYWYLGDDLRIQGVRFRSGRDLRTRVWRTAFPDRPYSWAVVENVGYGGGPLRVTLLRMSQNGFFWSADQYPERGFDMGTRGDAAFADLNNDGSPDLVTWTLAETDSIFGECMGCPKLVTERTWVERPAGFELAESRLVNSTYATWVLFVQLLRSGNRAAAARLLDDPARVTEAIANGWDKGAGRGWWQVLDVEPGQTWPRWFTVRQGRGRDAKTWVVHFVVKDGRWIIRDWLRQQPPKPAVQVR